MRAPEESSIKNAAAVIAAMEIIIAERTFRAARTAISAMPASANRHSGEPSCPPVTRVAGFETTSLADCRPKNAMNIPMPHWRAACIGRGTPAMSFSRIPVTEIMKKNMPL